MCKSMFHPYVPPDLKYSFLQMRKLDVKSLKETKKRVSLIYVA